MYAKTVYVCVCKYNFECIWWDKKQTNTNKNNKKSVKFRVINYSFFYVWPKFLKHKNHL